VVGAVPVWAYGMVVERDDVREVSGDEEGGSCSGGGGSGMRKEGEETGYGAWQL